MAKIGIDARQYSASTGRYARNLIKYLREFDKINEYFVFLFNKDISAANLSDNFKAVEANIHWYTLKEQIKLPKMLRRHHLDLVHFLQYPPLFYRGKIITTIHDLTLLKYKNIKSPIHAVFYPIKQLLYKAVLKNAVKNSEKLIVPTEFVKNDITNNFKVDPNKIAVIYESVDAALGAVEKTNEIDPRVGGDFVLYVGNAYPYKNLKRLVDAVNIINESRPLKLVLAGKTDVFYEQIKKYAGENPNIIFTGYVDDEKLGALYSVAKAFVFPSLSEGFGLPPLEAMSLGTPIVSSNASCMPEVLGDAAHYFNPLSVDDMAKKITEVVNDKGLAKSLARKGREQVKKYSWEEMSRETLDVYKEVLGNKRP